VLLRSSSWPASLRRTKKEPLSKATALGLRHRVILLDSFVSVATPCTSWSHRNVRKSIFVSFENPAGAPKLTRPSMVLLLSRSSTMDDGCATMLDRGERTIQPTSA
jgi:hypothetical protein